MNQTIKILILADDLLRMEALEQSLADLPIEMVSSLYQPGILHQVGKLRFDLALFDFNQQPSDLVDGLKFLREELYNQEIPLLLSTPSLGEKEDEFFLEISPDFVDLITKPHTDEYLHSRVDFWWRFLEQKKELFAEQDQNKNHPQSSAEILLVEDDELSQAVTLMMIEAYGFTAKAAASGIQALQFLRGEEFSLILMDIGLPGMNGLETTLRIRQAENQQNKPPIPILALSGNPDDYSQKACLAAGMNGYISKPVHGPEFKALLERWIQRPKEENEEPGRDYHLSLGSGLLSHLYQEADIEPQALHQVFANALPTNIEKIEKAITQEDLIEIKQRANHLRGSCTSFWALALSYWPQAIDPLMEMILILENLEELARSNQLEKAQDLFEKLLHDASKLEKGLEKLSQESS